MNAPFLALRQQSLRLANLAEPDERARIEAFVAAHHDATPFHRPAWLGAVAADADGWLRVTPAESAELAGKSAH